MSVALVIQHAKRMRRTVLSSVACLALQYSCVLSHKRHDLREKVNQQKWCVFPLQLLSEAFVILIRKSLKDLTNVCRFSRTVPNTVVRFYLNWNFLDRFSKKYTNIKFHENSSNGCRTVPCGRTDLMKPSRFSQFCEFV